MSLKHVRGSHPFAMFAGDVEDRKALGFDLPSDSVLTGTFADGTPFVFHSYENTAGGFGDDYSGRANFAPGTVSLRVASLPAVEPLITASVDSIPCEVGSGQVFVADAGSGIPDGFQAGDGSRVFVSPSTDGQDSMAADATVVVTGGSGNVTAFEGAQVNFADGGRSLFRIDPLGGSTINFLARGNTRGDQVAHGTSIVVDDPESSNLVVRAMDAGHLIFPY